MILSNFENFILYWTEKLMKTLEDLANELNREEWAVERMLKNRGYLKNNGDPRKSTIDAGYMNKNGLITNSGWNIFVDELGYKEHEDVKDDNNSDEEDDSDGYHSENDSNYDFDDEDDSSVLYSEKLFKLEKGDEIRVRIYDDESYDWRVFTIKSVHKGNGFLIYNIYGSNEEYIEINMIEFAVNYCTSEGLLPISIIEFDGEKILAPRHQYDDESDEDDSEKENDVPWEYRRPENYWNWALGPDHDEDDESLSDFGED